MSERDRLDVKQHEIAAENDPEGQHSERTTDQRVKRRGLFVGLSALAVLAMLIVIAVVVFLALRASRNKPLDVAIYPGAQLVNAEKLYEGLDHQQYVSSDSFEAIETFYAAQKDMDCERFYRTVQERPGQEPLKEGHIRTRCQVDHSGFGVTQYTTITIQPVFDQNEKPTGEVIIDIQRYWGD